jgi:hypothetical protein|tara:strand:- start:98 stop:220 length:123 start_codon:yes stop_codon:yes gene_type:complete
MGEGNSYSHYVDMGCISSGSVDMGSIFCTFMIDEFEQPTN